MMQLNKHGTFYIRNDWPLKILSVANQGEKNRIFAPNMELEAVDTIGLGRVMIKSLRYWSVCLGLLEEKKDRQGMYAETTALFDTIKRFDLYTQKIGTLLLLHRELVTKPAEATAWYWGFNEMSFDDFTKDTFVAGLMSYATENGETYTPDAYSKEFNCFKSTYVSDGKFNLAKTIEEDNAPFFAPLHLIEKMQNGKYRRIIKDARKIPSEILLYSILLDNQEEVEGNHQISIDKLMEKPNQIGQYFNLSYNTLIEALQTMENKQMIHVTNGFGNRLIEIPQGKNALELLTQYYI